jgi:ribosome-associated translation inhibitor RaiA
MKVSIHAGDIDQKGLLAYFATTKLNAVTIAFDSIESVDLWLKIEKTENAANKICELSIFHNGQRFFAIKKSSDFEESILLAIDELLTRINGKVKAQET